MWYRGSFVNLVWFFIVAWWEVFIRKWFLRSGSNDHGSFRFLGRCRQRSARNICFETVGSSFSVSVSKQETRNTTFHQLFRKQRNRKQKFWHVFRKQGNKKHTFWVPVSETKKQETLFSNPCFETAKQETIISDKCFQTWQNCDKIYVLFSTI